MDYSSAKSDFFFRCIRWVPAQSYPKSLVSPGAFVPENGRTNWQQVCSEAYRAFDAQRFRFFLRMFVICLPYRTNGFCHWFKFGCHIHFPCYHSNATRPFYEVIPPPPGEKYLNVPFHDLDIPVASELHTVMPEQFPDDLKYCHPVFQQTGWQYFYDIYKQIVIRDNIPSFRYEQFLRAGRLSIFYRS